MIERICLVFEALSIVICLHHLYGKKFKLDIATVILLAVDMIMMQSIDYYGWSSEVSVLIYPAIIVYCVIEFRIDFKNLVINNVICLASLSALQMIMLALFHYIFNIQVMGPIESLFANSVILLIVLFAFPKLKMKHFRHVFQDKEKLIGAALVICILVTASFLFDFKRINVMNYSDLLQYGLLFICVFTIGLLSFNLGKYKIQAKEIETELKMHTLYADSFQSLVDNIRLRQHEFDNHINTIYSQHFIYNTFDDLVAAQRNYCQIITKENRFNRLLAIENPIVIGFLYGKFIEADKLGIDVSYKISVKGMKLNVPTYKLVEILGDLINNAIEELKRAANSRRLYVAMEEKDGDIKIEVRNESEFIDYNELEKFFTKGYSRKGNNRGLGLYNIKNICDDYGLCILCSNIEIEGINWISFTIEKTKETI